MTLPDLLKRVEAASRPDRELDAEIAVALSGDPEDWVVNPAPHSVFSAVPGWWRDGHDKSHKAPLYTASLDATLGLVERVLSGWELELTSEHRDDAVIWRVKLGDPLRGMDGESNSPALALLAAMLQALIAHTPSDGAQDASKSPAMKRDAR